MLEIELSTSYYQYEVKRYLNWKSFISQPRTMSDDEDNIGPFPTEISNEVDVEDESREDTVGPLPTEMMPQSDDVGGSNDCSPAPPKSQKF
uniref:Uncharacterized protein n=1 Tax=Trichobilharzia regenti TaxID=157069 RepID=A0AA85J1T5_TRIRE|nr:unnamed protein product [Trichobilharzia regenti]